MKTIKNKILFNHVNNQTVEFVREEIKKMNSFFTGSAIDSSEKRSILSLLLKTHNNILNSKIEFWKDYISFHLKDVNREFKTQNPILNIANILNKTTRKIEEAHLNFEQEEVFHTLLDKGEKIVHVAAGTGSGKTWLSWLAAKEIAKSSNNFCALHITINESLEEQLITKYRNNEENINVDNKITSENKQYIIGTQEKIFALIGQMIEEGIFPEIIIVDEAHYAESEDLRGKFYKFVINKLDKEFDARFWLLSPFLKTANVIFNQPQTCIKKKISSFKSNKMFLKTKDEFIILLEKNKKDITLNTKFKNLNDMTLNYFSSKDNIYELAIKEKKRINVEDEANIINFIEKQPLHWKFKDYYVVNLLKKGIGVYHSSMPQKVKSWLFELEKRNVIKTIYATHAIANGIDFSFDNVNMHTLRSGKQGGGIMNVNLFNNLTGRSGRYNLKDGLFKKSLITFIDPNQKEEEWIENNRDLFYEFQHKETYDKKDKIIDGNIAQFELLKEEDPWKASLFLIDPRIDFRITEKIINNPEISRNLNQKLLEIFEYINKTNGEFPSIYSDEKDEETGYSQIKLEIISLFSNINKFYNIQKENSVNEENSFLYKKIFGNTLKSFYYNNEDEVYSGWWYSMKSKEKDEIASYGWIKENDSDSRWKFMLNHKFEEFISMYRKNVKFKMSTMINHAILLNNELSKIHNVQKFVVLNEIKKYKIINLHLLNFLREKHILKLLERLVSSESFSKGFNKKILTKYNYHEIFSKIEIELKNKGLNEYADVVIKIRNTIQEFYTNFTR